MISDEALLTAVLLLASAAPAALAQEIPKAEGHDQCPLGYVTLSALPASPYLLRGRSYQWQSVQGGG